MLIATRMLQNIHIHLVGSFAVDIWIISWHTIWDHSAQHTTPNPQMVTQMIAKWNNVTSKLRDSKTDLYIGCKLCFVVGYGI